MDLIQTLRSTCAARVFTREPVSDEAVHAILDTARFAPSGGNRQPWRVAVVKDVALRREMALLMQPVWNQYMGFRALGVTPFSFGTSRDSVDPVPTPNPLLDRIDEVPVVLAIAADLTRIALMDGEQTHRPAMTGGASVYPFCWSILLAARGHGYGGVITTFLSAAEAAGGPMLGLPEKHALVATIFLGRPETQPTKLTREPVSSFTTIDRFDGEVFGG